MLISLIVPCYNEEEAMPLFYKEASRVAAEMKTSHGADFEFIFVDDGSRDGTLHASCTPRMTACGTFRSAAILARRLASTRA